MYSLHVLSFLLLIACGISFAERTIVLKAPPPVDDDGDAVIIPNADGTYQILSRDNINEIVSRGTFDEEETEITYEMLNETNSHGIEFVLKEPPADDKETDAVIIPNVSGGYQLISAAMIDEIPTAAFDAEIEIAYEIFTKRNANESKLLRIDDVEMLKESGFDPKRPTILIVHGWLAKGEIRDIFLNALFKEGDKDVNFISVNWLANSGTLNYISARRRVNTVGIRVAKLIDFLFGKGGLELSSLQLIGDGFGAHIVGIAGKNVKSGKLPKIVGLDPASSLFSLNKPYERLSDTDASTVITVHTNAGWLGFSTPLGHISFYPNGGRSQPNCGHDLISTCAHSRSYIYYAESLHSPTGFYAWKCDSYEELKKGKCQVKNVSESVQMGGEFSENVTGVYYLETNKTSPFAIGKKVNTLSIKIGDI